MGFTEEQYKTQGFFPPCPKAVYIPSSSPICAGDMWRPDDSTETFVAYEHHLMKTGDVWTTELWWVPLSELPIQPLP
jgi:hypothetical protein